MQVLRHTVHTHTHIGHYSFMGVRKSKKEKGMRP